VNRDFVTRSRYREGGTGVRNLGVVQYSSAAREKLPYHSKSGDFLVLLRVGAASTMHMAAMAASWSKRGILLAFRLGDASRIIPSLELQYHNIIF
jgi:hypothetical protein